MDGEEDWNNYLKDHPIFKRSTPLAGSSSEGDISFELSLNTLPEFTKLDTVNDGPAPSGRRHIMVIKDSDIIVAVGSELRVASLGESKWNKSGQKLYKTLHTPNISFDIHQIILNPNGKFLAVAGAFQVAVVVLPRSGLSRLVPTIVDCKSIQVGQYYHASTSSPPLVKVDWHPWGEGGTTLLTMTVDGKMREYDISVDTEEPQQVLSFVPERKSGSYLAEDPAEREVASFTLGKGKADWGPLSMYAVMKSGDIYAFCPYMPKNASIPSAYVHALECFVHAKQEFLSQAASPVSSAATLSTIYDYQHKYVTALLKQLPPGTVFPSASRFFPMHPPTTIKTQPIRQGPFLLQPEPRNLEGSEGGDATDILYLNFGVDGEEESDGETERLGVVLVAFQDGKVDLYLDVEKVEARWEHKKPSEKELPMLAVYETIDLGLISSLKKVTSNSSDPPILDILQGNHPVFLRDPIHDETIYIYHAFGVHALQLEGMLQELANALRDDVSNEGDTLSSTLQEIGGSTVHAILTTFSIERRCSNPIVAVAVPNDVYLTYSIFIITSTMRITVLPLILQSEVGASSSNVIPEAKASPELARSQSTVTKIEGGPPAYISLLSEPFIVPPKLQRNSGLPSNPVLVLPPAPKGEFMLTPDTLRYLGTTVERFTGQIHDVQLAYTSADARASLQRDEFTRQQKETGAMIKLLKELHDERQEKTREKLKRVQETQKQLLNRTDRILQGLMKNASPELSEHERKWFQELKRMREEIKGASRYDHGSLTARIDELRREFDRLYPSLKELHEKETHLMRRLSEGPQGLGLSQAFELGGRSNAERERICNIEEEIIKLAAKLDMTLSQPPTL